MTLPPVQRPNGALYRPRALSVHAWDNQGEYTQDWAGVVVLGTHDVDVARPLAKEAVGHYHSCSHAVRPERVWWRDSIRGGERTWVWDDVRGRAGVSFVASDEVA